MNRLSNALAIILTILALSLLFGPQPAHAREQHPCYAYPIQDCVELIQEAGTPAYCIWAESIAGYGAYLRELGLGEMDLKTSLVLDRPPSPVEYAHIMAWLRFGWQTQKAPYDVIHVAQRVCQANGGNLPDSNRKHNQGVF